MELPVLLTRLLIVLVHFLKQVREILLQELEQRLVRFVQACVQ